MIIQSPSIDKALIHVSSFESAGNFSVKWLMMTSGSFSPIRIIFTSLIEIQLSKKISSGQSIFEINGLLDGFLCDLKPVGYDFQ